MRRYVSDQPRTHTVGPVPSDVLWERASWEVLGNAYGAQDAPYLHARLGLSYSDIAGLTIRCSQCGRRRKDVVLTRSGVYCRRCYDPARHGAESHRRHDLTAARVDPATCPHPPDREGLATFADPNPRGFSQPVYHQWVYCLDCGARLRRAGVGG